MYCIRRSTDCHAKGGVILKKNAAGLAAMIIALSSCSGASVEELLNPPKLDGEQTEIYSALKDYTNGDIILKYPKSGQYRSAFVVKDLDDEATDEAIVFYEIPNISDGSSLRLNFLDKQNGKWVSVYDFAASGSEVENVRFEDFGLGRTAIVVNYLMQNTSDKYTSVMTYSEGSPTEILNVRNIYSDVFDANGDGVNDLFSVVNDRSAGITFTGIYEARSGTLVKAGATPLRSSFAGIKDVVCGTCGSDETRTVFVDCAYPDGSFGTDAVISKGRGYYISPVLTADDSLRISNSYTPYISCRDVDGDGITEIPATVPFPEYAEVQRSEQICMVVWHTLESAGTKYVEKLKSFVGTKGDYVFFFPENWGDVTASISIADNSVVFSSYNIYAEKKGDALLTVYGAADDSKEKYESGGYIFLGRSETTGVSYYAERTDSPLSPEGYVIRDLFKLQ